MNFLNCLGPGILFACIAVGGANFVQATHAGADYGLKLIPLILLVYILKYPFFEFANRYCLATGDTLLKGYMNIGKWALALYIGVAAFTALPTIAALSLINANVTAYILGTTLSPLIISIGLLSLCTLILFIGRYPWLDRTVKVIMALLISSSLTAFIIALPEGIALLKAPHPSIAHVSEFTFLIALMGWMPAPLDSSVWSTLWTRAKTTYTQHSPSLREGLIDFNFGYLMSALLVFIFVALAAFIMFATNQSFSTSGVLLIEQLVTLFTTHIGDWGKPFISIMIFSILYSTTLTCLDAYPRAITTALSLLFPEKMKEQQEIIYWLTLILIFLAGILLSGYFLKSLKELVDIATVFAFLCAPIYGYLNYRVVQELEPKNAPSRGMLLLSKMGLLFLFALSCLFVLLFIKT